ncbi:hypothetical protein GCM10011351_21910 [Paraliobacillus quinghaiensis]|uniref:Uncharacterized protein n=1 Tax=Paraliobacillus quinghaiensis TaxID=470815 RepID=A0A917WV77_9BACI|nr:DUF6470 family protein [Paraliobacillus quinghaiensis]GGM35429.1 hypothetical protein GCM10011351_21910 [Paraliobacillus quinghaiensis]
MNFPQIRLQSQPAQISIRQTPGQQQIKQPDAQQTIQQPEGNMKIKTRPSKLTIDQTEALADLGFKSVKRMTKEQAQEGKQAVFQAISRRVRQGTQMMKIENDGNPIVSQAIENGHNAQKQFNIGWIPSAGSVKISYQQADVDIQYTAQKPVIQTNTQKAITNYQPGEVQVRLAQRNQLTIDFDNLKHQGIGGFEIMI